MEYSFVLQFARGRPGIIQHYIGGNEGKFWYLLHPFCPERRLTVASAGGIRYLQGSL
jgi:hypothetical protein